MSLTRISIVTPSFQQAETLEETIDSVLSQNYPALEYIVIDGGSKDGSIEVIKRYEKHLHYWVSEPDSGQSHAINKGLERTTGAVFNWLNSDDRLVPGALKKVGKAFQDDPELVCFGGQIHHLGEKGSELFNGLNNPSDPEQLYSDPVINQMATFYGGEFARSAGIHTNLHYAMDYGLWLMALFTHGHEKMKFVREHLADFRLHPAQKTNEGFAPFVSDIANLLADLARRTGENRLADILMEGHCPIKGFNSGISVGPEQQELVCRMIVFFLLKWHYHIYSAEELSMMKHFVAWLEKKKVQIRTDQADRFETLKQQTAAANWFAFRLRRKLKELAG